MIEIEDYEEQPPGKATIAIFTVFLPAARLRIRKMRLLRLKNQSLRVGMPSYSIQTPDTIAGQAKPEFRPYVEFSSERQKDFDIKCLEALKPFVKH